MDIIIGWFFFHPTMGSVVAVASQGRFSFFLLLPSLGDVVAVASQGRFFCCFVRNLAPKGHIWSKKVISGPEFLKNHDIWSDLIILDLL